MNSIKKTITVYDVGNGFFVETGITDDVTEFYLYHKDYGVKSFMFGINHFSFMSEEQLIESNLSTYVELYKNDYFDYSDLYEETDE